MAYEVIDSAVSARAAGAFDSIKSAIETKGVAVGTAPVEDYPGKIASISGGGAGGGSTDEWGRPPDWPDIKTILQNDTTQGYGGSYIQLITDHNDSITLTVSANALAFRTSDGAFYTATIAHTWDKQQDTPSAMGYKTRWLITYTNAQGGLTLNDQCLWTVLDLMVNSAGSMSTKRMIRALEFINNKNFSTISSLTNIFSAWASVVKLPDALNFSGSNGGISIFNGCGALNALPDILDMSTFTDSSSMFFGCYSLVKMPSVLDMTNVATATNMFTNSSNIRGLRIKGLKISLSISQSVFYTYDDLMYTINNLQTVSGQTLTIGATNMAKLSSNDIAVATGKGWTLA